MQRICLYGGDISVAVINIFRCAFVLLIVRADKLTERIVIIAKLTEQLAAQLSAARGLTAAVGGGFLGLYHGNDVFVFIVCVGIGAPVGNGDCGYKSVVIISIFFGVQFVASVFHGHAGNRAVGLFLGAGNAAVGQIILIVIG